MPILGNAFSISDRIICASIVPSIYNVYYTIYMFMCLHIWNEELVAVRGNAVAR